MGGRTARPSWCNASRRLARGGPRRGTKGGGSGVEGGTAKRAWQERREAGLGAAACENEAVWSEEDPSK